MNGLIPYEYSDRKISPLGGMRLIQELYDRVGMFDKLRSLPLQNPGSVTGVVHYEIIESFIMSVILGAGNCNNASQISHDEVLEEIKGNPSQSTMSRFFPKYDHDSSGMIFSDMLSWWFKEMR